MKKIILASQSPRRRELMTRAGFDFDVIPSTSEEIITKKVPCEIVEELALQKAMDVYGISCDKDVVVIGADTVVSIDGTILGKPKSPDEARSMLRMLSGRSHEVYTGVAFVWKDEENKTQVHTFYECTEVTFYPMADWEIDKYVLTGDPMDKAGAYGIQGGCAIYINKINGDYNNVVGLPIARLYQLMKQKIDCIS